MTSINDSLGSGRNQASLDQPFQATLSIDHVLCLGSGRNWASTGNPFQATLPKDHPLISGSALLKGLLDFPGIVEGNKAKIRIPLGDIRVLQKLVNYDLGVNKSNVLKVAEIADYLSHQPLLARSDTILSQELVKLDPKSQQDALSFLTRIYQSEKWFPKSTEVAIERYSNFLVMLAAKNGNYVLLEERLAGKINSIPDNDFDKAFGFAVYRGDLRMVRLLCSKRKNLSILKDTCNKAIEKAATLGHWDIVKYIYKEVEVDRGLYRNYPDLHKIVAATKAAGKWDFIKEFYESGSVNCSLEDYGVLVEQAAAAGQLEAIRALLSSLTQSYSGCHLESVFDNAIKAAEHQWEILKALLEIAIKKCQQPYMRLHVLNKVMKAVAAEGRLEPLKSFLEIVEQNGLENLVKDRFLDILNAVAVAGHLDAVKYFVGLIRKYWLEERAEHALECSAREAAAAGHLEIVKYIYEQDVQGKLYSNRTIEAAAAAGHLEIVKYIYEQDVQGKLYSNRIIEAAAAAAAAGHLEIVKYILEILEKRGLKEDVLTALIWAFDSSAVNGHLDATKHFVKRMSISFPILGNMQWAGNQRHTFELARQGAYKSGHMEVVRFLEKEIASIDRTLKVVLSNRFRR